MNRFLSSKKNKFFLAGVFLFTVAAVWLFINIFLPVSLAEVGNNASPVIFEIKQGQGGREIIDNLYGAQLIRSPLAAEIFSFIGGKIFSFRPGLYRLTSAMNTSQIVAALADGAAGEVTVRIPEGANVYQVDAILSNALVIRPGDLVRLNQQKNLEGFLFPDTYRFYTNANVRDVVKEMNDNFTAKEMPLLEDDHVDVRKTVIIASILEKEVADEGDRQVIAGIIEKRLAAGMFLDFDTTVCYAKILAGGGTGTGICSFLSPLDFKIRSPYNTYLYVGLPPAPIGNPGKAAIDAALHPKVSPYWYYLTDPRTGKTIFAKTLDEQNRNKVKYLGR